MPGEGGVAVADVRRLPTPVTPVWDWQMRAACRDVDSTVFFHPSHERGVAATARDAAAKRICAGCPVIEECARHALAVQEPYGVWGGLTTTERQAILHARRDRRHDTVEGVLLEPGQVPVVMMWP